MQGQRSTVESYLGTIEFDLGSTTNNSGMDQQIVWNNLLNPVEDQNLPDYLLSPSQESASLSFWNSAAPESSENPLNQGSLDETKMENDWATSATVNGVGGSRTEERQLEASSMFSSENINVNLNSNQMDTGHPFSQYSNSTGFPQNFSQNVGHVGTRSQVLEAGPCTYPYTSGISGSPHVSLSSASNTSGNSSRRVGFFSEDNEGRPSGSLDGRRLACKRKNIDEAPEPSSASSSANCFPQSENSSLNTNLNISRPPDFLSGASPSAQLSPRIGTVTRMVASDSHPSGSVTGNAESYQPNFWMRTNPAQQHNTESLNLWPPTNTTILANVWSSTQHSSLPNPFSQLTNQQSSLPIPFIQTLETRPVVSGASSHIQLHVPVIPGFPRNVQPRIGASSSRIGGSSSSPIGVGERFPASREETHSRRVSRNSTSEHSVLAPSNEIRQPVQVSPNWVLASGSATISENVAPVSRAGSTSGVRQSPGAAWGPHHNSIQYHRSISEAVRQSLFSTNSTAPTGQSVNVTPHHSLQTAILQDIGHQSGAGLRPNAHAYMRSTVLLERRRHGSSGVPVFTRVSAASREGRSRMISERFQNVLDLMQRGENLRLEDLFMFDQSVFFGAGDLLDRHRDMRLDVDNMSYEELLALEERIGNVNTGLSEETVLKCLKQRKYSNVTIETSAEVEPCCICQEEYTNGEDLGTMDCGHDFHSACIKKWLMEKNLCPICKTTALSKA